MRASPTPVGTAPILAACRLGGLDGVVLRIGDVDVFDGGDGIWPLPQEFAVVEGVDEGAVERACEERVQGILGEQAAVDEALLGVATG